MANVASTNDLKKGKKRKRACEKPNPRKKQHEHACMSGSPGFFIAESCSIPSTTPPPPNFFMA
jgi:hypothetical protein